MAQAEQRQAQTSVAGALWTPKQRPGVREWLTEGSGIACPSLVGRGSVGNLWAYSTVSDGRTSAGLSAQIHPKPRGRRTNGQIHRRSQQSANTGDFRYALQQARLSSCRALLVAQPHSTQGTHSAGPRGFVQPHQMQSGGTQVRTRADRANGDLVIVRGRFSGDRPANSIATDIVRMADGVLAEHWDVPQDDATKAESQSGLPMFGDTFPG